MNNRACEMPVGVFDSGVGGVSVLREMVKLLPRERFFFYGDNKNAPYGVRPEREIIDLTLAAVEVMCEVGIKALVVACNTATSAAIELLRAHYAMPVIGMEPALKPAAKLRMNGKVLVLATPATLRQQKFHLLYEQYGQETMILPCPGLMEFAERGELCSASLRAYLAERFALVRGVMIDAVVLGCTHYVFLKKAIGAALPGVPLIDGNLGTARRLADRLECAGLIRKSGEGGVEFATSGDAAVVLPRMETLFTME